MAAGPRVQLHLALPYKQRAGPAPADRAASRARLPDRPAAEAHRPGCDRDARTGLRGGVRHGAGAGLAVPPADGSDQPEFLPTRENAASAKSRSSRVCAAETWQRTRACPCGTTGKPNPVTKTPSSSIISLIADRLRGLPEDDRDDRGLARERLEPHLRAAATGSTGRSRAGSDDPLRVRLEVTHRGEGARRHGRRQRVGEQLRPRALHQVVDDLGRAGHEPARRAAERLAEGRGDDVHLADHPEVLRGAAAGLAEHAGRVGVVHRHHRVVLARRAPTMSGSLAMSPSMLNTPSVMTRRVRGRGGLGEVGLQRSSCRRAGRPGAAPCTAARASMMLAWLSASRDHDVVARRAASAGSPSFAFQHDT